MNPIKPLLLCTLIAASFGCSQPLEIRGKGAGDIVSASGTRDCSLEDYQAGLDNCAKNLVADEYDEVYTAVPRPGAQFRRWANYCPDGVSNTCAFYVAAEVVREYWGDTMPSLQAVFRPTTNSGLKMLFMADDSIDDLVSSAALSSHAKSVGFTSHAQIVVDSNARPTSPQEFWDVAALRTQVQGHLNGGDVDVLVMTFSPTDSLLENYAPWVDYALAQNPDTRFMISVPGSDRPSELGSAGFKADFDATHAQVHGLVDSLRAEHPGVDFYCVPTGQAAVALYDLFAAGSLPDVTALEGEATALFEGTQGEPGNLLKDAIELLWLSAIYDFDLSGYAHDPGYATDIKAIAANTHGNHTTSYNTPPHAYPDEDGDGVPDAFDGTDLLSLLPSATRAVYQVYPSMGGALSSTDGAAPWSAGPLQVLEQLSAGIDLAGSAHRLILAQSSLDPRDFLLLADLGSADFTALTAGTSLTSASAHLGYSAWSIDGTGLQLAKLDGRTIVIGQRHALESALNVFEGFEDGIASGELAAHLKSLNSALPNSFVVGLPALYGATTSPGDGDSSLNQATAASGSFSLSKGTLQGSLSLATANAQSFTDKLLEVLTGYEAPVIAAQTDTTRVELGGLSVDDVRPLLKTLFLDMNALDYTEAVAQGGNAPLLNFTVGQSPNSLFINFEFKGAAERTAFEAAHLPAGTKLAPLSILENDTPRYYLVLNIYQSSGGLVSGARAEWSVFIEDPDTGVPRYLVVEAKAESASADSVNLLVAGEPVSYIETGSALVGQVAIENPAPGEPEFYFSSVIDWPQTPENRVPLHREFAVANDYIFWGNAVADRILYNSTAHAYDAVVIDGSDVDLIDNSLWAPFIDAEPVHALVYTSGLDYVISPWWNLDEDYLDLTPEWLTQLINFKNNFYPGMVQSIAKSALRGEGLTLNPIGLGNLAPTARYHFDLLDPAGLLASLAEPGAMTPVAVELFDGESAGHYLTLSVFQRDDDPCGLRAEWSTYIEGPDGKPNTLRLDTFAAEACLDPASLMTVAADVSQGITNGVLDTRVNSPFTRLEATVTLGSTTNTIAGTSWIEAGDRVCSLNDICDSFFYDGGLLLDPVQRGDGTAVQLQALETPWDGYIDVHSVRVGVRDSASTQAVNPWRNLRSFPGVAPAP